MVALVAVSGVLSAGCCCSQPLICFGCALPETAGRDEIACGASFCGRDGWLYECSGSGALSGHSRCRLECRDGTVDHGSDSRNCGACARPWTAAGPS